MRWYVEIEGWFWIEFDPEDFKHGRAKSMIVEFKKLPLGERIFDDEIKRWGFDDKHLLLVRDLQRKYLGEEE